LTCDFWAENAKRKFAAIARAMESVVSFFQGPVSGIGDIIATGSHECRPRQTADPHSLRFSSDKTMVFFTSNLFGASYVFGVEVKKAENPAAAECEGHGGAGAAVEAAGSGAWEVG
jgi:hypothetical protein